jgi:hypothetical protein
MSIYVVYHKTDHDDFRRIPFAEGRNPFVRFHDDWIYTSKESTLKKAVAERGWCLFIVGIGKPKRFFLWAYFQFLTRSDLETGAGVGWMLNPPQLLEGPDFEEFMENACGQFGFGLQNVSDSPYAADLVAVAAKYNSPKISRETLRFCTELRSLTENDEDLHDDAKTLERYVRRALARAKRKRLESKPSQNALPPARKRRTKAPSTRCATRRKR